MRSRAFCNPAEIPVGSIEVLDTDLATTLQADKLFRIDGTEPYVLHLELEANPRTGIPRDLMRYNTLIDHVHDLPVESVLILLRPKAQASDQSGVYRRRGRKEKLIAEFHYRIERVWERPIEYWLGCGSGLAPLALLTDEANAGMESSLDRLRESLTERGVDERTFKSLMSSTYVLCGLRHNHERIESLFRRFSMLMEESTTYQAILAKGRSQGLSQGLRTTLIRQGTKRFGAPNESVLGELHRITDPSQLELLSDRILDAASWDDLIAAD